MKVGTALIGLALAVLTVAVYVPVRDFGYIEVDDPAYVSENPQVRAGLTGAGVVWAFTSGHAANWHPITWLSHMLDVELFGLNPGAHHLVNVALHVTGVLLLLMLLVRLTGDIWRSGFVAAIFALHPLHVESVAWVAERKDVLSGVFWMLTLWAYVAYAAAPTRMRMLRVAVVFGLGLMTKPMLVTLPVVLLLLDLWPLRRWSWDARSALAPLIREKLLLFALSTAAGVITLVVQDRAGAVASLEAVSAGQRLSVASVGTASYLLKFVWPTNLSFLYPLPEIIPPSTIAWSTLALAVVTGIALRVVSIRPAVWVGWVWYLVTLFPVSGVFQTGVQAIADRYMYLPMIGISIFVVWAIPGLGKHRVARYACVALSVGVVMAMAVQTSRVLPVWRTNSSLWTNAMMQSLGIGEYEARIKLGRTLLAERRFDEARDHFGRAVRLQPGSSEAHYGLGLTYLHARRPAEAISPLEEAVRLAPGDTNARADLAAACVFTGRLKDAVREYRTLIEMRPAETRYKTALDTVLALLAREK